MYSLIIPETHQFILCCQFEILTGNICHGIIIEGYSEETDTLFCSADTQQSDIEIFSQFQLTHAATHKRFGYL